MIEPISIPRLLILLVPLVLVGVIYWRWTRRPAEIGIATLRMALQLIAVGYLLSYLFGNDSPLLGVGILGFMIVISAWIAKRTTERGGAGTFGKMALAIAIGGGLNLILVLFVVMHLDPWYQPRIVIPIAGMIFSSGMNAVSLGAERFERESLRTGDADLARREALRTAMIPQINSFLAVGLVALPGMMTGQILSGVSPLVAVRYQIMVMCMIMGTAGLSTAIYLAMSGPRVADDSGTLRP